MKSLFFALVLLLPAFGHAGDFTGLVAFGDSLSDMGNRSVKRDLAEVKYRETWVRQLAGPTMLNVPEFKPSGMSFYFGGTNYAVGGATTELTAKLGSDRNRGQNLTQQISRRYLNPAFNTDGVRKDALHVIVIGTNDLMLQSLTLPQIGTEWADLEKVGADVARSTEGQIHALASAGVRHVMWGSLFDTAQAPSVASRALLVGPQRAAKYLAALTKATLAHNQEMDAAIARLRASHPALRIIKLDLFARFAEIAADPAKFGFTDIRKGGNSPRHLFSADGLHPTPQGHRMLAEYAFAVLTSERLEARAATAVPASR